MLVLRQSTAIDIRMGPFSDATDGVTPETGITLGAADQAEVLKENGAATVAMAGTFAAITGCDGWYDYTVATGDVDAVGEVVFVVQDASVCLPVFVRAMVVEEAVYDAFYDAGSNGLPTAVASAAALTTVDTVVDGIQTDLDNGTDGLGAIKTSVDAIPTTAMRGTDGVDTATMRGTDGANTTTPNTIAPLTAAGTRTALGLATANMDTQFTASATATGFNIGKTGYTLTTQDWNTVVPDAAGTAPTLVEILQSQLTESYAADNVEPTLTQAIFLIQQLLQDFSFSGTTQTVRRIDGSTTAATYTLDDAANPTDKTRAT